MRGNGLDTSARPVPRAPRSQRRCKPGWSPGSIQPLPLDPPRKSAIKREEASGNLARAVLLVLLPFAAGYYLSYLYRSINALIAGDLVAELGLTAADLGLLTSVYFLAFAAVQLPCGVLLDRYGPRLIDSALLLVAAAGSLLFALADGVATLLVGRALIGLGVAVGLMAGLKAIVLWFPPERVALANGWYIMLGALGALSATGPAEAVVQALGWRGLFAALAVASAAVALLILLVVPERKTQTQTAAAPRIGFLAIYLDPRFLRIAPLAALGVGTSFSLQGLWAAPWLADVEGLDRPAVVAHLTFMAVALAASALLLGAAAERLRRAGIPTELFLSGTLALSMAAQLALLLGLPVPSYVLFAVIGAAGAATVLSFAVLAQYFPKEVSGRANAALGVLNMGTAFGLQCLSGFIVALWPAEDGHYPAEAHQAALGLDLVLQAAAFAVVHPPGTQDRSRLPAGASDPRLRRKTSDSHRPLPCRMPARATRGLCEWPALARKRRLGGPPLSRRSPSWHCSSRRSARPFSAAPLRPT